jgi:hypothetical protein
MTRFADKFIPPRPKKELSSNLIAAAPKLLEAMKELSESLNCGDGVHYCPNCDRSMFKLKEIARAAIAEAEGENKCSS